MESKICTYCKKTKLLSEFYNSTSFRDNKTYYYKECDSKKGSNYYHTKKGLINRIYQRQKRRNILKFNSPINYTKEELINWLNNSLTFNNLFINWENNNFKTNLVPSCDRLNDYKEYSLDNLQVCTWQDNNNKYKKDCLTGKNRKMCKSIIQLDLNNNIVKEYFSLAEASRITNNFSSNLSKACKNGNACGGYKWKYKN